MITFNSIDDVVSFIKKEQIMFVDFKFTDLIGTMHHTTVPAAAIDKKHFSAGVAFDGSSIKGFKEIHESDMLLRPDITSGFIDPFVEAKTLSFLCDIFDPLVGEMYEKCVRTSAKKAEQYLQKQKIADISYWGPEAEFYVFEKVNFSIDSYGAYFYIGHSELNDDDISIRSSLTHKKSGYFPVPPADKMMNFRNKATLILQQIGIDVEVHHHEVGAGGQCEIGMHYDSLTRMADKLMLYKYVIRNLADQMGMSATFMPKPIYGDNGSGMHCHQSLWKNKKNLFYDAQGYAQLSEEAHSYVAGILTKINSLLVFCAPTLNSYRRLVPHFEAPIKVAFSKSNRSAAVRIPMHFEGDKYAKRIEFRCPDPSSNPYLCFTAQLIAGTWGMENSIKAKPFGPHDKNIYEQGNSVNSIQTDLFANIASLEKDELFQESEILNKNMIQSYSMTIRNMALEQQLYPTPTDYWYGY